LITCLKIDCFAEEEWELVTGINETSLDHIAIDVSSNNIIYAASKKTIYKAQNSDNAWVIVFSVETEDSPINFITVHEKDIFVCAKNGLFKSSDMGLNWKKVFKGVGEKENNVSYMAFSRDRRIYLATDAGLFISEDNGTNWVKDNTGGSGFNVKWVDFLHDVIFIVTEKGVYKNSGAGWKRTFVTSREDAEYNADTTDESLEAIKPINSMVINKDIIFLATDSGIFISEDKGETWKSFIDTGLISLHIKRILVSDVLYAITDKGIFIFSDRDNLWQNLYKGMTTKEVSSMAIDSNGAIWVTTKKGLYKRRQNIITKFALDDNNLENQKRDILKKFENEPAVSDVQEAAIKYAEVHPDKIREWRNSANKKAFLPNVSIGLDRYLTDYWHWDSGTNPDTLQKGKDAVSWDISMTWDMGEFIWNNDQTSIDVRSKLMVELRDDIMNEVTRTYFERRRLQIELFTSPPKDLKASLEKELRLQEMTADIDALTGNYFSAHIKK
jgi:photosystem II stability/assembly factor-like uncharacterized protein